MNCSRNAAVRPTMTARPCSSTSLIGSMAILQAARCWPSDIASSTAAAILWLRSKSPMRRSRPWPRWHRLRPCISRAACHRSGPSSRFAIPRRFEEMGVRRYGFHGLSFEFIARRLAEISPALPAKRTVAAHLGNGASLCAMRHGRSVDTTMGLTPLDGLMMGTRCGVIDPGVLLYLQPEQGMSVNDIQHMLYLESGLLGVSGLSADVRVLLASDDQRASDAIKLFTFSVAREVAAMANTLGGLECLVFTGGIGEHSKEIRQQLSDRLQWLGVGLDHSANDQARRCVSVANSGVDVLIIPTSEETTIARHCASK